MITLIKLILTGGVRIFRLKDIHGNVLWEEDDDSSDSVRPYFLINGTESEARVRSICKFIDKEIAESYSVPVESDDFDTNVVCRFYPAWDGKITRK